jgi:hypothetical protein
MKDLYYMLSIIIDKQVDIHNLSTIIEISVAFRSFIDYTLYVR